MDGRGARRRAVRRGVGALGALALVLTCTGCIGTIDRADFDARMQERSGGIPAALPLRAIAALEEHLDTQALTLRSLNVDGEDRTVSAIVQDPRQTSNLDSYRFHDRTLDAPSPVQVGSGAPMESSVFRVDEVPALRDIEPLVQQTLGVLAIEGAHVDTLSVARAGDGVVLRFTARSDRRSGTVEFDGDGQLLEVTPG